MDLSEHDRTHLGMVGLEDFGTSDLNSWWEAHDELEATVGHDEDHGNRRLKAPKTRSVPSRRLKPCTSRLAVARLVP